MEKNNEGRSTLMEVVHLNEKFFDEKSCSIEEKIDIKPAVGINRLVLQVKIFISNINI